MKQRIIFLHLPKTAGLTLHNIIERQYTPQNIHTIDPSGVMESVQAFKNLSAERRAEIHLLKGHMNFASELHKSLPEPVTYFTLLRNPIDRVISHYYFTRSLINHHLNELVSNTSLQELLEQDLIPMFNNEQTRWLAGEWKEIKFGEYREEALERAKSNLREHFSVVGLTERFDETLLLLKNTYDWPRNVFYTRVNVTAKRPKKEAVSPATLEAIVQANLLDIELYQYAVTLFEEQMRQQGPLFPVKVRAFKSVNRLFNSQHYQKIRKWSVRAFIREHSVRAFVHKWARRIFRRV
jgi:hypothetical protein